MAGKEELSPEEKLLKVIQNPDDGETGGEEKLLKVIQEPEVGQVVSSEQLAVSSVGEGEKAGTGDRGQKTEDSGQKTEDRGQKTARDSERAIEDRGQAEKSGLKIAGKKPVLNIADKPKIGVGMQVPETGAAKIGTGAQLVEERKGSGFKFGVKMVNKFITIAALIILCFVAWEAVSFQLDVSDLTNVDVSGVSQDPAAGTDDPNAPAGGGLVEQDKVLSAFRNKPIVVDFTAVPKEAATQQTVVTTTVVQSEWQKVAKESFKMVGRSRLPDGHYEAVVSDQKTGELHFLKTGDSVAVDKQKIDVKEVSGQYIKFTDGKAELTIE